MKRGKREVKRAYGLGRRFLAMFLAMVMCTSMLQLTAFAAEYKNQVMPGSYIVDANGNAVATTDTVVEQDGFTLKKAITQTGKDAFNITLTVQTSEKVTTNAAAIQLVIDTSSSMNICTDCDHTIDRSRYCYDSTHSGTDNWGRCRVCHLTKASACADGGVHEMDRLTAVKNILAQDGGFLDKLAEANTGAINVSVVTYDLSARTMTLEDKVDASNVSNWINIKDSENLGVVKDAILNLTEVGNGTNTDAGLKLANNRLKMDEVKNAGVKYTVLLTDGYANCVGETSTSTSSISLSGSAPRDTNETTDGTNGAKTQIKALADLIGKDCVYVVGYGVTEAYLQKIVTSEGTANATAIAGENTNKLSEAFANIAKETVEGMSGAGTTVTDPMGTFITMGDVTIEGVTDSAAGLTWELDPTNKNVCTQVTDKETGVTTYTYTITYPITLNTAAEGFEEVYTTDETAEDYDAELAGKTKYYPTNGRTFLSVPQDGDAPLEIEFLVPGVCGEIPEVKWSVEYYLQNANSIGGTATYTKDESKSFGPVDVWTIVNAPDGYVTKYASNTGDDYTFASGNVTMKVTPNGANVMRLYYNLVTEDVVVNHYYKTDKINVDGTLVPGSYSDPYVQGPIPCKVNSDYTATPDTKGGTYTLDGKMPNDMTITVTKDGDNVINLYYTRTQDDSVKTSAQVNHVYRTYAYVLGEDGKYGDEPVLQGEPVTEVGQAAPLVYATTPYNVSTAPIEGYEDYILNTSEGHYSELAANGMTFIIAAKAEDNVRTLYFDKVIDRRDPVTVTVKHYYTKSVTSVEGGKVITTVDPDGELGNSIIFDAYAGETFTATEINSYKGDDNYVSDPGNAAKLVIRALPNADSVIELYYTLDVVPETSIIVNHYWVDRTEVTVDVTEQVEETVVDADGNEQVVTKDVVVGKDTVVQWNIVDSSEDNEVSLYVGQTYTAPQMGRAGYVYDAYPEYRESNDTGVGGIDHELNLYYYHDAKADNRDMAEIAVQHNYVTKLTTIVAGEVAVVDVPDGTVTEKFSELRSGDTFEAVPVTSYNGQDYVQTAEVAPVTLQPGTNTTIVLNYVRTDDNRVEVPYTVNYEYRTYTMTVNEEGVAGYWTAPAITNDYVSGKGYVDQKITLDPKSNGFDPVAEEPNPAVVQTLKEEGNTWTFVYAKYVPLSAGSVIVNHHYSQQTINLDGSVTWTSKTVTMDPVVKYLGETYIAEPVINGYQQMDAILDTAAFAANEADEYVLTVSSNHVVDFHYKKVVDYREFATYTVTHDYYLYDYDGTLLSHPEPMTDTYTGYVAHPVTAHPQDTDYTLTKVTFNDEELAEAPYTEYLVEGENAFVFTYVKILPRDTVDVTVIHNYYQDEASMSGETAAYEYQQVETFEVDEDEQFTAEEYVLEDAAYTYTWHSADPENKTIVAVDDVDEAGQTVNVIIMNYVRATAEYKVIHIYNRNGVEEDRVTETLGGLDGDVVLADSIDRVPVHDGKTYTFQSISGDLVLNEEEQQVIVLDSEEMQTVILVYNRRVSSGGGGGGGTIIIPEPPVPLDPVPQPEPEVEIPEEDVPLVEIPEEEVPLVDVPKTGDASALWMLMSVLSGTGLAGVTFLGRKKKEEE